MRKRSILALGFAASIALTGVAFAQTDEPPSVDEDAESLHLLDGVLRPDGATEAGDDAKSAQSSSCSFSAHHHAAPTSFVLALPLLLLRRKRRDRSVSMLA